MIFTANWEEKRQRTFHRILHCYRFCIGNNAELAKSTVTKRKKNPNEPPISGLGLGKRQLFITLSQRDSYSLLYPKETAIHYFTPNDCIYFVFYLNKSTITNTIVWRVPEVMAVRFWLTSCFMNERSTLNCVPLKKKKLCAYGDMSNAVETRLDTQQSSRGWLGRSSNAKKIVCLRPKMSDRWTDGLIDTAMCRVACPRLEKSLLITRRKSYVTSEFLFPFFLFVLFKTR